MKKIVLIAIMLLITTILLANSIIISNKGYYRKSVQVYVSRTGSWTFVDTYTIAPNSYIVINIGSDKSYMYGYLELNSPYHYVTQFYADKIILY